MMREKIYLSVSVPPSTHYFNRPALGLCHEKTTQTENAMGATGSKPASEIVAVAKQPVDYRLPLGATNEVCFLRAVAHFLRSADPPCCEPPDPHCTHSLHTLSCKSRR